MNISLHFHSWSSNTVFCNAKERRCSEWVTYCLYCLLNLHSNSCSEDDDDNGGRRQTAVPRVFFLLGTTIRPYHAVLVFCVRTCELSALAHRRENFQSIFSRSFTATSRLNRNTSVITRYFYLKTLSHHKYRIGMLCVVDNYAIRT